MSWSVVVPTCRPESFKKWYEAWKPELGSARIIVVHDQERVPDWAADYQADHIAWADIPLEYGARKTDMVRSWGIYWAWRKYSTYTLTLDDDVLPRILPSATLMEDYERVFDDGVPFSEYLNVGVLTSYGKPLRGFPYKDRMPVSPGVQYGGWSCVLDYDAPTQLNGVPEQAFFSHIVVPVPKGTPVTGCIMNCAWRTEMAPIMWQLPLVDGKYNRFGDIWSGLFQKKTLDHLGIPMVVNGKAQVDHVRASDPITNLEREAPGIRFNETLWSHLRAEGDDLVSVYRSVTDSAAEVFPDDYASVFLKARDEWLALFS